MTVTRSDIQRALFDLELNGESHVLVHSSYRSIGGVEGGPETVVRALVEALGTVMMPAFTSDRTSVWDSRGAFTGNAYPPERPAGWHETEPYTYDTPANPTMGVLVETFRTMYPVRRSPNPHVSFIAHGAIAERLVAGSDYDGVEPIQRLMAAGGHVLLLGVTHSNSTSVHLAERLAGRSLFVRYALTPDGVRAVLSGGCGEGFDVLQPHVEHLERRASLGGATLRCYELHPYVEVARALIERDPFALLCDACPRCEAHRRRVAV